MLAVDLNNYNIAIAMISETYLKHTHTNTVVRRRNRMGRKCTQRPISCPS